MGKSAHREFRWSGSASISGHGRAALPLAKTRLRPPPRLLPLARWDMNRVFPPSLTGGVAPTRIRLRPFGARSSLRLVRTAGAPRVLHGAPAQPRDVRRVARPRDELAHRA